MFALLDIDKKTVIGYFAPNVPYEKIVEEAGGKTLIPMTVENSPAYLNGTYIDGKFYPPKGNE